MKFSQHVCWKPEMVWKVMDVVATQPPDHIFMATHSPVKMYRQDLIGTQAKVAYDEEQFLKDFLEIPNFVFVPILGTSETGKSHLVRWLYTRIRAIRKAPKYRVLFIPKVGTNLRDIISLILKDMEGPEFDDYRIRLESATNSLTETQAQEQLLSNLAIAIGPNGVHDRSSMSEVQSHLVESLPAILFDPFFREEYWLKDGSIIQKLVAHILGKSSSIEIVNEHRQFSLDDLPRDIRHTRKASAQAQDFYSFLIDNLDIREAAVDWLNKHLNEAIVKVFNLGREDLMRLMLDVRRALARQGIELILLIEDFAKLQGIDREILAAIIEKESDLCSIRTALACTEGFFKKDVDDTVQTRINFSINLDVKTVDEQSLVTPKNVQQLTARYLNAVRLQESDLENWLARSDEETGEPIEVLPNACTDCEYQASCHAGFGSIDGVGLYPFNSIALEQMRKRKDQDVFNPRILIKSVLRHTLEYHRLDLQQGRFPSTLLLDHFGGSGLSASLKREIYSKDITDDAPRREALINLWTNGQILCNLKPEVHTAFNLSLLTLEDDDGHDDEHDDGHEDEDEHEDEHEDGNKKNGLPQKLIKQLQMIDDWQNGKQLDQYVAQDIRELIYPVIGTRIDWDIELFLKKAVIGKLFLQRNINFFNAQTSTNPKGINLCLPLTGKLDLRDTAIAFQALLLYEYYRNWEFTYETNRGLDYYHVYANKLEEWSKFILKEVPKYTSQSRKEWDPIPSVVELLAISGCMSGCKITTLEDLVNTVFADLEKVDSASRVSTWQKLFSSLKKQQPKLREVLESRIPCTKGSRSVLQVIDAVQLIEPLKAIASKWEPQVDISDVSSDPPFDAISKARKDVDELLGQAVRDERDRHLAVYQRILKELGENFSQKDVVDALQATINQIKNVGVAGGVNSNDLNTAMDEFKRANLKAYINSLERLQEIESDNVAMLLPLLSTLRERPVEVITNFLDLACKFVVKAQDSAQGSLANLRTTGAGELEESCQNIEAHLIKLQNLANDIKGESVCS